MTVPAQVLVAAAGAKWESPLLPLLGAAGAPVRLARRCVDLPDLVAAAAAGRGSVALVSSAVAGWDVDAVTRLRACGVVTVVVAESAVEAERSRRLGAQRVLSAEVAADPDVLVRTLLDTTDATDTTDTTDASDGQNGSTPAAVRTPSGSFPAADGRLVAVWGPTGAPGRSTVALGLAAAAARQQLSALLVDADVYGGAVAQMLAVLDEVSGVLAAARAASAGALDVPGLTAAAREVAPGFRVLTGLPRADRWTALRPAAVREILVTARRSAALVVVDCGFCIEPDEERSFDTAAPQRNGATLAVLEAADVVLTVGSADPLGLGRLARARSDLRDVVPSAAVRLVVNRVRSGSPGWSTDEVAATLLRAIGEVPLSFLPLDQPAVDCAEAEGRPVVEAAPASALSSALDALASAVSVEVGLQQPAPPRGRRAGRGRDRSRSPSLLRR